MRRCAPNPKTAPLNLHRDATDDTRSVDLASMFNTHPILHLLLQERTENLPEDLEDRAVVVEEELLPAGWPRTLKKNVKSHTERRVT